MRRLKTFSWASTIALTLFTLPATQASETLQVYTEEFPPFNYTRHGELQGVSTAIVHEVLRRAGLQYTLSSHPWAVSYQKAREEPNALIYSISRREKRESHFKWIDPIIPTVRYSVFALKTRRDIRIERFSDFKRYQIGTTVNDAREAYLLSRGLEVDDLQRVSGKRSHEINYGKLKRGEIELWPMPDAVMSYVVRKAGDDPRKLLRRVFGFSELTASGYYLAANPAMPDETVEAIRRAIVGFKYSEDYEALLDQWGLGTEGIFADQDIR